MASNAMARRGASLAITRHSAALVAVAPLCSASGGDQTEPSSSCARQSDACVAVQINSNVVLPVTVGVLVRLGSFNIAVGPSKGGAPTAAAHVSAKRPVKSRTTWPDWLLGAALVGGGVAAFFVLSGRKTQPEPSATLSVR